MGTNQKKKKNLVIMMRGKCAKMYSKCFKMYPKVQGKMYMSPGHERKRPCDFPVTKALSEGLEEGLHEHTTQGAHGVNYHHPQVSVAKMRISKCNRISKTYLPTCSCPIQEEENGYYFF